jgi:glycosyltransferase involved in cell wall biosynthesis
VCCDVAAVDLRRDLCRLVFCGRLEEVKGGRDAISILSLLPEEYYLEILGEGIERARLEDLADRHQLGLRVKFRGWVDGATRDNVLASAGLLLMPSLWDEAFGMAGIEALAQGTPVVAYDVGGISEWCRDGAGMLVPCGEVQGAARAVLDLTEDPVRWAVHSCAAKRIAQLEFPKGRFARELDEVIGEAMGHDRNIGR